MLTAAHTPGLKGMSSGAVDPLAYVAAYDQGRYAQSVSTLVSRRSTPGALPIKRSTRWGLARRVPSSNRIEPSSRYSFTGGSYMVA